MKRVCFDILSVFKIFIFKTIYIIPYFLISTTTMNNVSSNSEKISFSVIKNNSSIGYLNMEKLTSQETTTYFIDTNVKAKLILSFDVSGSEKSIYKEDILIFSSVFRKINNKVKANQSLFFANGKYFLSNRDKKEFLDVEIIRHNLVTLYFSEPIGVETVFCDSQNVMVSLFQIGNGVYKVVFPKGNYNVFHYKNGKCTLIEVVNSFYDVKLIPNT